MVLEVYHTQEYRNKILQEPIYAVGNKQWLGEGYYFWQDYEFAEWWGSSKKQNPTREFSVYKATINFDDSEFIDTVFNEKDYYNFVKIIEKFAVKYFELFKTKPTLELFNDFISDFKVWTEIQVIRFQDLPMKNNDLLKVKSFYYKKRIQIRVNNPLLITNFAHERNVSQPC